jgi:periplasmic divalent cation tolerance protein
MSDGMTTGLSMGYVTVPNDQVAQNLSDKLVEAKLAACVNTIPGIKSTYVWDGKVNRDTELQLIIKTRNSLRAELIKFVKANHPYEVPEIIFTDIAAGSPDYLKWVMDNTKGP